MNARHVLQNTSALPSPPPQCSQTVNIFKELVEILHTLSRKCVNGTIRTPIIMGVQINCQWHLLVVCFLFLAAAMRKICAWQVALPALTFGSP